MSDTPAVLTKDTLFKQNRSISETKAFLTDQTARSIMRVESEAREAKTLRLRKERLDMEQLITPAATKSKKTRKSN